MNLYIIDGYGLLFRAYYAVPKLTNKDGVVINAIYGFVRMLNKVLRECNNHAVLMAFDSGQKNFRHEIYAEYKANRRDAPEDLIPQFAIARDAVEAFGVKCISIPNVEADDVIASYVEHLKHQVDRVCIISSDKDLMQLIDDKVYIFEPNKSQYITAKEVAEKFGVHPTNLIDVMALTGDSADNIKGVKGVGVKFAVKLIQEFGCIEGVYDKIGDMKNSKLKQNLLQYKDDAFLAKQLVKLKNNVSVDYTIEELLFVFNIEKLKQFLQKHDFNITLNHQTSLLT